MKLSRYDFLRSSLVMAAAMFNVMGCTVDAGYSRPRGNRPLDDDDEPNPSGNSSGGTQSTSKNPSTESKAGSGSSTNNDGSGGTNSTGTGNGYGGTGDDEPDGDGEAGQTSDDEGGNGGVAGEPGNDGEAGDSGNNTTCSRLVSTIGYNHGHVLVIAAADVAAGEQRTYDITGDSSHPHQVVVTAEHFAELKSGATVVIESDGASHTHSVQLRCG